MYTTYKTYDTKLSINIFGRLQIPPPQKSANPHKKNSYFLVKTSFFLIDFGGKSQICTNFPQFRKVLIKGLLVDLGKIHTFEKY